MQPIPHTSGPAVASVFHRLLALVYLGAWVSLLWQVDVLIGSRGLLPLTEWLAKTDASLQTFASFPTVLLWAPSDFALHAGIWCGIAISAVWIVGFGSRACAFVSALLYLSYATAAREFLHFQWDNMLIEAGVLAAFLPRDRSANWIHILFRVLLFKLYLESGIAKWQSHLGDWHDGSAMTFYYETAPLPTWIAWYAHALPQWWHELESRLVLVLELLVPWAIFGPRSARLTCCAVLTAFQLVNIASANYGFFCYLSLALHVFLLDDRDLRRTPATAQVELKLQNLRTLAAATFATAYIGLSTVEAIFAFAPPGTLPQTFATARSTYRPWRVVNTYHLFGHITRQRIETEIQTFDGTRWKPHHLRYKPGAAADRPPFVAPHQPRIDFRLWFYGLSYQRGTPTYVQALVERICIDPNAVDDLFSESLPVAPQAVRLVFWDYRFTATHDASQWWHRTQVATSHPVLCSRFRE